MRDKLQEIKQLANNAMATGKGHVDLTTYALTWLIERLEHAQQEFNTALTLYEKELENNQKLVECLEWYGDGSNYQQKPYNTDSGIRLFKSAVDEDKNGQRARQTLSEVKGNA